MRVRDIDGLSNSEILRKLRESCEWVGSGSSRVVFALSPRRVIKIADSAAGIAQNKREVKISERWGYTGVLARVIWYNQDYSWIVSERAKMLNYMNPPALKSKGATHWKLSEKAEIWDIEIVDNWGIIGRRLVLCDYGLSPAIHRTYYR
jgi:hypothetical protein